MTRLHAILCAVIFAAVCAYQAHANPTGYGTDRADSATTAERDAIASPQAADYLYNSDDQELSVYNGSEWMVFGITPAAEMFDSQNTDAYTIHAANEYHCYHTNGMGTDASSLSKGWTFDIGGGGTSHVISSVADGGGGAILVTTATDHGLEAGDIITQTDMGVPAYVDLFKVLTAPSTTTYTVTATYSVTATGFMDQCSVMIAPATGAAGRYLGTARWSATSAIANHTFDFVGTADATILYKGETRRKFGAAGDYGSGSAGSFGLLSGGERVGFLVNNISAAGNLTIRNVGFNLLRL